MSALPIKLWVEQARSDDWHTAFDGSDIRQMLSEIIRLQALNDGALEALENIVNAESGSFQESLAISRARALIDKVRSNG